VKKLDAANDDRVSISTTDRTKIVTIDVDFIGKERRVYKKPPSRDNTKDKWLLCKYSLLLKM